LFSKPFSLLFHLFFEDSFESAAGTVLHFPYSCFFFGSMKQRPRKSIALRSIALRSILLPRTTYPCSSCQKLAQGDLLLILHAVAVIFRRAPESSALSLPLSLSLLSLSLYNYLTMSSETSALLPSGEPKNFYFLAKTKSQVRRKMQIASAFAALYPCALVPSYPRTLVPSYPCALAPLLSVSLCLSLSLTLSHAYLSTSHPCIHVFMYPCIHV
jgi:hypothetical protein